MGAPPHCGRLLDPHLHPHTYAECMGQSVMSGAMNTYDRKCRAACNSSTQACPHWQGSTVLATARVRILPTSTSAWGKQLQCMCLAMYQLAAVHSPAGLHCPAMSLLSVLAKLLPTLASVAAAPPTLTHGACTVLGGAERCLSGCLNAFWARAVMGGAS